MGKMMRSARQGWRRCRYSLLLLVVVIARDWTNLVDYVRVSRLGRVIGWEGCEEPVGCERTS